MKTIGEFLSNLWDESYSQRGDDEISHLALEKNKFECYDHYILILENSLVNEHKMKNNTILSIKEDLNKVKDDLTSLEIENKRLLDENEILRNSFTYKIKSFLKN